MLHQDSQMVDPIFEKFTMQMEAPPPSLPLMLISSGFGGLTFHQWDILQNISLFH
jgi:hypothetical protein